MDLRITAVPVGGRSRRILAGILLFQLLVVGTLHAQTNWPRIVPSKDGTPISYEAYGAGEPVLIFVHGWSCDARYWRSQTPLFSEQHRVIALDLAGHGHSGAGRTQYTMESFGEDVRSVLEAEGIQQAILIGHSMGGSVIAEAARLMPNRVIGLIGVDTLENIEFAMTGEEAEKMTAPFEQNFQGACRQFVSGMIYTNTNPALREWILSDMSAAPPAVAVSAMKEMINQYVTGDAPKVFDSIHVPVITINGSLWPVNYEANRRHMVSYDAIIMKNADHFLMMDRSDEFNLALEQAIRWILEAPKASETRPLDEKPVAGSSTNARAE